MKEAFEKMTGMPDAWTNPALMVSRNAFIQGWEARAEQPAYVQQEYERVIYQCPRCATSMQVDLTAKAALAQPAQEPVAWIDPTTLHHLKIGLEGVHLVYETEMVNFLPLYEKPQGWRDNVAQAYLKGFDEGCKSISARNGDTTGRWSGKTENIGSLGMPVNVPVTPQQRPWVGLTFAETCDAEVVATDGFKNFSVVKFARAIEVKLKEKNA
jgi:hypothetical protein